MTNEEPGGRDREPPLYKKDQISPLQSKEGSMGHNVKLYELPMSG